MKTPTRTRGLKVAIYGVGAILSACVSLGWIAALPLRDGSPLGLPLLAVVLAGLWRHRALLRLSNTDRLGLQPPPGQPLFLTQSSMFALGTAGLAWAAFGPFTGLALVPYIVLVSHIAYARTIIVVLRDPAGVPARSVPEPLHDTESTTEPVEAHRATRTPPD